MPRSKLFGYSVEHEAGQVVITIEGSMAGEAMQRMSRGMPAMRMAGRRGRGGRGMGGMAMPFPFDQLGSPSVALTSLFPPAGATPAGAIGTGAVETDIAQIFAQGFDRSYDEYDAKLQAYRAVLESQVEPAPGDAAETETPASRRKQPPAEAAS